MTEINKSGTAAFLLQLERRLRPLHDTHDILALSAQMLGQRLGAQQVSCFEVDPKHAGLIVQHAWSDGMVPGAAGEYVLGDELKAELAAARPVAISDVAHDTRTSTPAALAAFFRLSVQALLYVPITREGRLAALVAIHSHTARLWHADDIELAVHVSERAWSTILRAQVETRLRALSANMERLLAERTHAFGRTWTVSPDLLGVLNLDGYFEHSNPAWQATLGWSEEEIRRTRFLELLHPDDLLRTQATWEAAKQGQPALRFENRYRHKLGGWRWLSWVAVPEGNKVYCSARDISLEKKLEAELLQASRPLHGSVARDLDEVLQIIASKLQLLQASVANDPQAALQLAACSAAVEQGGALAAQLLASRTGS
ncbi:MULTISPECIES: PAS domain-containing protein [unclassified Janthinobacterium]|uniref:PAS domain-containing protein n=1 Tax=unclassified Janthinobacterium TaxID=2610881 RepID=UPI001618F814|nr:MULTISPECIES: PAS domain-containing protein [unclassified Janthinobacterium]MBB5606274.1 PAS domain S-box-containing protein [Janthinobacterium sp. S3T4]MBB5611854.1 PAS domain S-box-containing protein [Janthinobacterium sp. S3M3]